MRNGVPPNEGYVIYYLDVNLREVREAVEVHLNVDRLRLVELVHLGQLVPQLCENLNLIALRCSHPNKVLAEGNAEC